LVDSQCPTARKIEVSEAAPAELVDRPLENDSFALELRHRGLQVFAHQVEHVAGFVAGMKSDLGWGQGEDQPAVTRVDRVETENVLCYFHHRLVHEGGWQVINAGREFKFLPPERMVMRRARGPGVRWAA
jgi:hypothetical protein